MKSDGSRDEASDFLSDQLQQQQCRIANKMVNFLNFGGKNVPTGRKFNTFVDVTITVSVVADDTISRSSD